MASSPNDGANSRAPGSGHSSTTNFAHNQHKRLRSPEEVKLECSAVSAPKKAKTASRLRSLIDSPDLMGEPKPGIFGSVTQDIEYLIARRRQVLGSLSILQPKLEDEEKNEIKVQSQPETAPARANFIDLGEDDDEKDQTAETMRDVIVIEDDEEIEDQGSAKTHRESVETAKEDARTQLLKSCSKRQPAFPDLVVIEDDRDIEERSSTKSHKESSDSVEEAKEFLEKDSLDIDLAEEQSFRRSSPMLADENKAGRDKDGDENGEMPETMLDERNIEELRSDRLHKESVDIVKAANAFIDTDFVEVQSPRIGSPMLADESKTGTDKDGVEYGVTAETMPDDRDIEAQRSDRLHKESADIVKAANAFIDIDFVEGQSSRIGSPVLADESKTGTDKDGDKYGVTAETMPDDRDIEAQRSDELHNGSVDVVKEAKELLEKDSLDRHFAEGQSSRNSSLMLAGENRAGKDRNADADIEDDVENKEGKDVSLEKDGTRFSNENEIEKSKGVYVGVEDDIEMDEGNHQPDSSDDDGLDDIWKEMAMVQEFSKRTTADPPSDERHIEGEDYCDHHFVLRDDIGDVCRICGVIRRGIEEIIEYQLPKGSRSIRTYAQESRTTKDKEPGENCTNFSKDDFMATEIAAHPRHRKQMKSHQVEGFNFLCSSLVSETPSGCILAHAPGSGKTFMIISFTQCFMTKYPDARPLVVLPKGILSTWKREFQKWQVEDIPLYDFYSHKAHNRSQQLEVLQQWVQHRSILFLGYQQFSTIVCDNATCPTAAACQKILLKRPSILILDEGHTPRNEDTDILNSLKKVQTPRKVVLSGTLYQNHVKEVFNILDLVRPRFLRSETSRPIVRRILSRVSSVKSNVNARSQENDFFDSVERVLHKDEEFKRKVTVIKDLREMTSKVLHFYKGDFLDELPGLLDFTVFLNLSPQQKNGLQELTKSTSRFNISSKGCLLYVHPQLRSMSKASSTKEKNGFDEIDRMLQKLDVSEGVKTKFFLNMLALCESGNEKLLVFSQFVQPLRFLERLVVKMKGWSLGKEIFVITGDSNSESRELAMDQFNNSSDARVFFGSIKACGEGISLVGASRIIILDVHLNPSVTRQALGRAYRPGQTKKVYTYRLVAAESPEEEDHSVCFRKESISKMWFEWNEFSGRHDFEMETVDVQDCGDPFLESPRLSEDVKALFRR